MSFTSTNTTSYLLGSIRVLLLVLGSCLLFIRCNEPSLAIVVPFEQLDLKPLEGKWYYQEEPFTGMGIKLYPNGMNKEHVSFEHGKKHGKLLRWFPDGQKSYEAFYIENKQHGTTTSWFSNGKKDSESNFIDGVVDGVQWQWYPSGKPFKKMNIKDGIELGMQQAWWESGKLYNNYEAKNGRIFGLKRAKLCHELQKENLLEK